MSQVADLDSAVNGRIDNAFLSIGEANTAITNIKDTLIPNARAYVCSDKTAQSHRGKLLCLRPT